MYEYTPFLFKGSNQKTLEQAKLLSAMYLENQTNQYEIEMIEKTLPYETRKKLIKQNLIVMKGVKRIHHYNLYLQVKLKLFAS